jgi:hypothetical protein
MRIQGLKILNLFTSLVYLWLTYVYAHVDMVVCTRKALLKNIYKKGIMLVYTRRPLQVGLLYIITIYARMIYTARAFLMRVDTLRGQVGGGWALEIKNIKNITHGAV